MGDGENSNPVGQLAVRGGAGSSVRSRDTHDPIEVMAPINPYRAPDASDHPMRPNTGKKANQTLRALVEDLQRRRELSPCSHSWWSV